MAELDRDNEVERCKAELYRLLGEAELTREQRNFIESMLEGDKENGLDESE